MSSTVAPMARAGAGHIPGNDPGQDNTSSSTYTHVQGAYGAPTGAVAGAADGRRTQLVTSPQHALLAFFLFRALLYLPEMEVAGGAARTRSKFPRDRLVVQKVATSGKSDGTSIFGAQRDKFEKVWTKCHGHSQPANHGTSWSSHAATLAYACHHMFEWAYGEI